jgi:hypothetical protein
MFWNVYVFLMVHWPSVINPNYENALFHCKNLLYSIIIYHQKIMFL